MVVFNEYVSMISISTPGAHSVITKEDSGNVSKLLTKTK